ncbi:hypothetical protein RhiirA1_504356 [Rhizophagus irregularis]|uniref:Uncharacterized protein n=1 Tax=Rhizophagus irregularis TaxID=588596 RepID=A0A2N0QVP3_9GLOM|nr:hypothetical protein RhiirA1_504356 [Rhizophagus irregularis]
MEKASKFQQSKIENSSWNEHPVETKEVHCTATYGRKSVNFQWTASSSFQSASDTVEIVTERKVIQFSADEDLLSIIWTANPKVDLDIVVDTSQQPFSSYTFPKMKVLFGLKADSYDHLPCIEIGSSATPEEIRNSNAQGIPPITSTNEATHCEFISAIIYGVVSIFDGVDWVITKVQSGIGDGNDNGDGNPVEVFLCSPTPTPLPINYPSLSRDDLVGPIEKLFGQIKWVFDQQKSSLVDGKRMNEVMKEKMESPWPYYLVVIQMTLIVTKFITTA